MHFHKPSVEVTAYPRHTADIALHEIYLLNQEREIEGEGFTKEGDSTLADGPKMIQIRNIKEKSRTEEGR